MRQFKSLIADVSSFIHPNGAGWFGWAMVGIMLLAFVVGSLGAGPATQPATRPVDVASDSLADCKRTIDRLKIETADLQAKVGNRFNSSAAKAAADRDIEAKKLELESDRKDGSPEEKLAAITAYSKARTTLMNLKLKAFDDDPLLAAKRQELNDAIIKEMLCKIELDKQKKLSSEAIAEKNAAEVRDRIAHDPKYAAMKSGRVLLGMTESEMNQAAAQASIILESTEDKFLSGKIQTTEVTYTQLGSNPNRSWYRKIIVKNGIVTTIFGYSPESSSPRQPNIAPVNIDPNRTVITK